MHLKFSGMTYVELICMTYLWTHIHFRYPKPLHFCWIFCRVAPPNLLPPDPKMLFSSVTAEQEELVAKMLASGMDEATAYQYLQQLCGLGVAGKGSKLNFYPIFAKISTSPKTLYSYIPAYIHLSSKYISLYKYLQDIFSLYLCFGFSLSRSPASCNTVLYFNSVQPM